MKAVTAHFELSGAFWILVSLLIVAGLSLYFRDEVKTILRRLEQSAEQSGSQT
jgi:hypothetical protein